MLIIGLTGNIGSGKSLISAFLRELGAAVIDADIIAREIVEPGKPALADIREYFGPEYILDNGNLDRKLLGSRVFACPEELKVLQEITHPRINQAMKEQINSYKAEGKKAAVLDVALLFEGKFADLCQTIWVVAASHESILSRLEIRDGLSRQDGLLRLNSQMSPEEMQAKGDKVIFNNGSKEELYSRVESLYKEALLEFGEG